MAEAGRTWHDFDCGRADTDAMMNQDMSEAVADVMEQSNTMQNLWYVHVLQVWNWPGNLLSKERQEEQQIRHEAFYSWRQLLWKRISSTTFQCNIFFSWKLSSSIMKCSWLARGVISYWLCRPYSVAWWDLKRSRRKQLIKNPKNLYLLWFIEAIRSQWLATGYNSQRKRGRCYTVSPLESDL
jgi:hypothetical protein